jgi:hypothetical protein
MFPTRLLHWKAYKPLPGKSMNLNKEYWIEFISFLSHLHGVTVLQI